MQVAPSKKFASLVFLTFLCLWGSFCTSAKNFEKVFGGDLNPFDTATVIYQDSSGYMWFAISSKGYIRYDGQEFTLFNDSGGRGLMTSATPTSVLEREKNLMFATRNGINKIDLRDMSVTYLKADLDDWENPKNLRQGFLEEILEDSTSRLWFIGNLYIYYLDETLSEYIKIADHESPHLPNFLDGVVDPLDRIWASTYDGGIYIYSADGTSVVLDPKSNNALPNAISKVRDFLVLKSSILLATDSGVFEVDFETLEVRGYHQDTVTGTVSHLAQSPNGVIWAVGRNAYRVDDGIVTKHFQSNSDLPYTGLFIDSENTVWLSDYSGGVFKYTELDSGVRHTNPFAPIGLSNATTRVKDLALDGSVVWIATNRGVVVYNLESSRSEIISDVPPEKIYGVESTDQYVFATTKNHLFQIDKASRKVVSKIRVIDDDHGSYAKLRDIAVVDGDIFLSLTPGIAKVDISSGRVEINPRDIHPYVLNAPSVSMVYSPKTSELLFSAYGAGFFVYNPLTLKTDVHLRGSENIPSGDMGSVEITDDGNHAYIYYAESRQTRYNVHSRSFEQLDLPIRNIRCIVESKGKSWYFQGDGEIYLRSADSEEFQNISRNVVPEFQTILPGNCARSADGVVVASTYGGLATLDSEGVGPKTNLRVPKLSINVSGAIMASQNHGVYRYKLSNPDSPVTIKLRVDSFVSPSDNMFRYQSNTASDWSLLDSGQNSINLASFGYGESTITVQGSNNDGIWSESTKIVFSVPPPYYLTGFALTLYVVVAGLLAWLLSMYRTSRVRMLNRELESKVDQRTDELRSQRDVIQQLLRSKNELFENISHEFRTPISLLLTHIEKLENSGKESQAIRLNATRLLRMINYLLELSQQDDPSFNSSSETQNVSAIAENVVDDFKSLYDSAGISLVVRIDKNLMLNASEDALEKILANLLSNALKFTPEEGRVELGVTKSDSKLRIEVRDSGPGIPEGEVGRIFERFYRGTSSPRVHSDGLGIGLALLKKVVESNGGSVTVDSEVLKGARFIVEIPGVCVGDSLAVSVNNYNSQILELEKASVDVEPLFEPLEIDLDGLQRVCVVIEDNIALNNVISEEVNKSLCVAQAFDGSSGLELVRELRPDLVITDIRLPYIDGYGVCEAIRSDSELKHTPILMVTALSSDESRMRALKHGADAYITKPFSMDELTLQLTNLLTRSASLKELYQGVLAVESNIQRSDEREEAFIQNFTSLVEECYSSSLVSLNEIASKMALSPRQVQRKVKALIGQGPMEYIRKYRLTKAAALLKAGMTPTQACYEVGMTNPAYFSRTFKGAYGMTPSEYAKSG